MKYQLYVFVEKISMIIGYNTVKPLIMNTSWLFIYFRNYTEIYVI